LACYVTDFAQIFPIEGDRPGGPPYSVDTSTYAEALQEDPESEAWTKLLEEETSRPEFKGREKIAVWQRK
jgi:hypothetical protein